MNVQEKVIAKLEKKGFKIDFNDEFGCTHLSKRKKGSSRLVSVEEDGDCNGESLEDFLETID